MAGYVEVLTDEQCMTRLSQRRIGRVSVTKDALPVIVPVNFVTDGASVIFRTRPHGLLARACDSNVIAFEVDDFSVAADAGWSVLVVGVARLLTASDQLRALTLGLAAAAGDDCDQFVQLRMERISGREIATAPMSALAG
jgi:nitroimidazol reductase NimA-like FMN-containing flavoprotein (pyridoxamine 5'-phosphate oxidase superfamily)